MLEIEHAVFDAHRDFTAIESDGAASSSTAPGHRPSATCLWTGAPIWSVGGACLGMPNRLEAHGRMPTNELDGFLEHGARLFEPTPMRCIQGRAAGSQIHLHRGEAIEEIVDGAVLSWR